MRTVYDPARGKWRYDEATELRKSAVAITHYLPVTGQVCAIFSQFHPGCYRIPQGMMIFLHVRKVGKHWIVSSSEDAVSTILDTLQEVVQFAWQLTGTEHQGWLPDYSKMYNEQHDEQLEGWHAQT